MKIEATLQIGRQGRTTVDSRLRIPFVLTGVLLGILVSALDMTVVGTALPRVIAELRGLDRYAWVFTAYMLAQTASMPVWGKLSDLYGRKWFYLGSLAMFLAGSMFSGMATSMNQLILFRALQGLGAGAMLPIGRAILGDIFPPAERGKYEGLTGGAYGLAAVIGPTLGGLITDHWTWRWVFFVNLPVGVCALAVLYWALPRPVRKTLQRHSLDIAGSVLLVLGILPLLLAFSWAGSTYAWGSPQIIGLVGVSGVLLLSFILAERRASEPTVPLSLFRNGIFTVSAVATFLEGMGTLAAPIYIALFIQGVMGQSATNSGIIATPTMAGVIVASILSGVLASRTGRYRIITVIGLGISAISMLLLAGMNVSTSMATAVINMIIFGVGIGSVMALFTVIAQNAVDHDRMGVATSTLSFFGNIGGTLGAAILGSLMNSDFLTEFQKHLPAALTQMMSPDKLSALRDPQTLLDPQALDALKAAFASYGPQGEVLLGQLMQATRLALGGALHDVFLAGAGILVIAALACLFLKEIPLKKSTD